jgi:SWI/SNF-related matrix-associated actin-dependent regulator of chromatin subfamily A-like protein 1
MSLMPFQKGAITWLSSRPVAFLALEQGLGKTVVASVDLVPPAIVVCPASMKWAWHSELSKWRPELQVQVIRKAKDTVQAGADVWIVNYDILDRIDLPTAHTVIADESHYAKSYQAKRTKALSRLIKASQRVRLLSGTPVVNRPIELWPMLYATRTTKLGYHEFGLRYCRGWQTPWNTWDFSGASRLEELNQILAPVMLRLTKAQVLPELPDRAFRVVALDLPVDKREQAFSLDAIERNPQPVAFEALPDILHMNAHRKLPMAIQHIQDALQTVEKVVVFAHHTDIIDALMSSLAEHQPVRVTGADSPEARHRSVDQFQNDPACRVFIGNIRAAGVGLTLTAASRVIFVESSWTPADLLQCADRCHRIGQKNPVLAEILTIHQSIDAHMLHSALRKMDIINRIIKESEMPQPDFGAISQKLMELAVLFDNLADQQVPFETEPAEPAAPPAPPPPTEPHAAFATIEEVREALAKLIDAGKRETALAILKDAGAAKVGDLAAQKYGQVVAAAAEALS